MRLFVLDVERDADPDGAWIPMAVRMKLDLAGRKIRLPDWERLDEARRSQLLLSPVGDDGATGEFAEILDAALADAGREPAAPLDADKQASTAAWRAPAPVPEVVVRALDAAGRSLAWERADLFARFCLHHYARRGDAARFARALDELT